MTIHLPDSVAVVQVILVWIQENVGMNHHRVRRLLEVSDDSSEIMFSKNCFKSRLNQMQHRVRHVTPGRRKVKIFYLS